MCNRERIRRPTRHLTVPRRNRWRVALPLAVMLSAPAGALAADDALQDPFMPPGWNEPAAPAETIDTSAWRLESTLTSNGRRVAIINGRAVRAGDRVDGARVLGIDGGRVRLAYDGHRFTIRRPGNQVRKR